MSESRFAPGSTALYAVLWLAVLSQGWAPLMAQDSLERLNSPAASSARKTSRDLELAEANDRAAGFERRALGFLYGSRDEALASAIGIQREVLAYLEAYEPDLIACADALGVTPSALVAAHQMLEAR